MENEKTAQELIDTTRRAWAEQSKPPKPKKEFDVIRIFWKVGIVVIIIIGINHCFAIYSNIVALRQIQQVNQKDSINTSYYNDGVRIGWKAGLLKCSEIFIAKGEDYRVPFNLSKDSTAYHSLLWKRK